ncbi:MAG: hypothetical protein ACYTG6_13130 [Planctomycetota bacterium]|jgi:hypothetical protein
MRIALAVLFGLFVCVFPLRAEEEAEEPQPHTDEQLEEHQVLETFEEEYGSDDMDERLRALRRLGQWRHKKVLKQLKRIWEREDDLELLAAAAEGLGNQTPFAREAGRSLVKYLEKREEWASIEDPTEEEELDQRLEAKVLIAGIRAVGDLGYKDGWKQMKVFIEHHHDFVAGEMMITCGKLKEYRALKVLLEWFNFYPDGYSWAGGSVRVDTGAAGNADANAARAKWKARYGGRARKARPNAWEMLIQSLEMITGVKFEKPEELEAWMEENKALLRRHGA